MKKYANITTFDGQMARADIDSSGRWYIHCELVPRPGAPRYVHYLNKEGKWYSACTDRWDSMEEAIEFAKRGPTARTDNACVVVEQEPPVPFNLFKHQAVAVIAAIAAADSEGQSTVESVRIANALREHFQIDDYDWLHE